MCMTNMNYFQVRAAKKINIINLEGLDLKKFC